MDLFSRNISMLRKANNLTKTGLAKELRVSHQLISRWEKGKSIPDAEMLTSIARYYGITVDRLLNENISLDQQPVNSDPQVWPPDKEEPVERTQNPIGVLFLIPILFVLLAVIFLPLVKTLLRALTEFNALELPKFIGFENYKNLFSRDEIFQVALKNTFNNAFFTTLIVGTLTFAISYLIRSVHKAVRFTVVLLFDLVSVFVLAGGYTFLFSGDAYGFLNSRLIQWGIIKQPILFLNMYIPQIQLLLFCLILFGPMLSVLSLVKTRGISKNKLLRLLFPLEHSLQVYIAGGLPILLLPLCLNTNVAAFGFPSTDYAAHTIIDHFYDFGAIRFQLGYASAISIVSLLQTTAFLLAFFVLSCGSMHVAAIIKREMIRIQTSPIQRANAKKTAAYIISGILICSSLVFLFPLFVALMTSFKSVSENFVVPQKILPEKFNIKNYSDLFTMDLGNYRFSRWLFNMIIIPFVPALTVTAVSAVSAYGVSYFDYKARRMLYSLILLSFILLPTTFLPDYGNSLLVNLYLPLSFYAAFFSAAPLIGFVFFKAVIERARQFGCNLSAAVLLNGIPVVFITYVMCFINPFVNQLMYSHPGFTIYYFQFYSAGTARIGIDSAAKVILTGITFGFLLFAAVTAMVFFPRRRKKRLMCEIEFAHSRNGT